MKFDLKNALCSQTQAFFDAALTALAAPIERYRATPLPHFLLPQKTDDIAPMRDLAARLGEGAKRIVVLGTGGSSLGAQVLAQISGALTPSGQETGPQLIFADNLDATSFAALLAGDMPSTRFLVISKSGNTMETMMQLGVALAVLQAAGLSLSAHVAGIAGEGDNALRHLAAVNGFELLPHEAEIGGRFSVLSNVGLLHALWADIDPLAVRGGAMGVLGALMDGDGVAHDSAQGAALQIAHMQAGRMVNVLMPYGDRLERLSFWYRQLWAESLGKQGKGSLPVNALGPVDQHSQLQLYLDGPDDKLFTLITHPILGQGAKAPASFADYGELAELAGRTMGDLVAAHAHGTYDALVARARPVRGITLSAIDAETIGALVMHFMLEVIFTADILGVNPFDQPAVEESKIGAKHYLTESR